ncbi:MAG TPA: tetratricopeptide repeat protein [Candidatus Woesebacteria bacterium]|mgnify:CR=1 FL=1|nr:tetratricopeptide repeat protein [Candidatus Woesebacteria bacterium]
MSQKKIKKISRVVKKDDIVVEDIGLLKILKDNWKFLVIILVGTVLIYLNGLSGNFVSDDYATIPQNPLINNLSHQIGPQSGLLNLAAISHWFIATFFGNQNPVPYHVFSLFLYLAVEVVFFIFVLLITNKKVATLSTIIFSVLPIHVESVTWISGKPYLLNSLFVLLALDITLIFLKSHKRKYLYWLLILLPWVFFADKVRSFSYFLIIGLLWVSYPSLFKTKIDYKKLLLIGGVLMIGGLIFLWPKILERVGVVNSGYNSSESYFYNPFFQYPTAVAKYLQLLFIPIDLTLYHTMYTFPVWLNWLIIILYITCLIYFYIKNKNIFFWLSFIFLAASPSMAPVKVSWLVAERYMMLGSTGFAVFLSIIIIMMWEKFKIFTTVMLIVYLVFNVVLVVDRNDKWTTNHKLWVNTCQVSPNSHNAWNNIGDDYDKLGQYESAIKGFTQSIIVKPNYADAYHNRANIFYKVGRLDMARDSYNVALTFSPSLYQTYLSLTQIDLVEKKHDLAMAHIQQAIQLQPENIQNYYLLSVVYAEMGKKEEATALLKQILSKYPDYQLATDLLNKINGTK